MLFPPPVTGFEESAGEKSRVAFTYTDGEQARLSGWLRDGRSLISIWVLTRKQWLRGSERRAAVFSNYRNVSGIV